MTDPFGRIAPVIRLSPAKLNLTLAVAGAVVAGMSDVLVGSIEQAARDVGLSQFFVGAFVVAIIGNAAEHYVAVVVAAKDKIELSINIALGALLVLSAPFSLIDPEGYYTALVRPSLVSLWLSQLIVFAVYPLFARRHRQGPLAAWVLASIASALAISGLGTSL